MSCVRAGSMKKNTHAVLPSRSASITVGKGLLRVAPTICTQAFLRPPALLGDALQGIGPSIDGLSKVH